jgi:hypothetical protein
MAEKVTALESVRSQQSSAMAAYEPRSFDEAMRLATVFAASGLLGEVRNEAAALLVMATGAELGISATTALRSIYIVKGKPMMSSDLMVGLCIKRKDVCEYFICTESTDTQATYQTKRVGVANAITHTFTMADAQRARLAGGGESMYAKYPKTMLRHRAAAELARQVYPDIVLGLYSDAEKDDIEAIDVTPAPQLVTEPVRTQEEPDEPIEAAMARWRSALFTAATIAECDRVRREVKARLQDGTPQYKAMVDLYKARVKELKTAHERPAGATEQQPQEGEIVTERQAGEDG